ncbi:MAG: hypothetical protein ACI9CP_000716 [Cryomorphaceae bacterium]|jgi:hypothetical protein
MELARSIKDAENALRDFIEYSLEKNLGADWMSKCGVPSARIDLWRERKAQGEVDSVPNKGEERLVYYAPFEDLSDLISENWIGDFQSAFTERDRLITFIKILEEYRDPQIHRRELFVYQKHLVLGITGEIRAKITAYRSLLEVGKEGYPRIEYIKDSLGNIWVPGKPRRLKTNLTIHPGTTLEFIVQASDPEEKPLEFKIHGQKWETGNILFFEVTDKHVQKQAQINITIRSSRKFHAYPLGYDDRVVFEYQIIPKP